MRNDPPTSLRRGYGYHQARAAGLGGLRADRSPRQVNLLIKGRKAQREAEKQLREEIAKDAEWAPFVEHWIREGLSEAPAEFQRLTPAEVEDCFCIYKDVLRSDELNLRPRTRC